MNFFRLLCVDDNSALLQTLALGFRAYGFDVITASHGVDALMQFKAHHGNFEAVLTDMEMPNMDGVGLVKHLRALGYRGRILVMSGRMSVEDGRAYQDLEVSGFLHKPFEISMVATMLMQDN
jgi:two-component system chemotaxis response regulator CheY